MTEDKTEDKPANGIMGYTEKDLAVKISAYEDFINEATHKLTLHLLRSATSMSYEDMLIAVEGFKALEDYIITKRVLRLKCLDDSIYFLVLRDLAEILDDITKYLIDGRVHLKDRIEFRILLFRRDVYGFIKECPNFNS
jgi:hypothetical protein